MYWLDTNVVSELRKPRPHGAVVHWIETVVTRNVADFKRFGVKVFNPFASVRK